MGYAGDRMDIDLTCRCGKVHGVLRDAAPEKVNRAVCYCDDCQAFAHHLGRADLLGPHAGSDIVQASLSSLSFDRGREHLACVRLFPRGLYRFHTTCCDTPVGNTVGPLLPFVGLLRSVFTGVDDATLTAAFGPVRGEIFGNYAIGAAKPKTPSFALVVHTAPLLLRWKLGGKAWPNPFFAKGKREPVVPVRVLTREERDALRPRCGPRPA